MLSYFTTRKGWIQQQEFLEILLGRLCTGEDINACQVFTCTVLEKMFYVCRVRNSKMHVAQLIPDG